MGPLTHFNIPMVFELSMFKILKFHCMHFVLHFMSNKSAHSSCILLLSKYHGMHCEFKYYNLCIGLLLYCPRSSNLHFFLCVWNFYCIITYFDGLFYRICSVYPCFYWAIKAWMKKHRVYLSSIVIWYLFIDKRGWISNYDVTSVCTGTGGNEHFVCYQKCKHIHRICRIYNKKVITSPVHFTINNLRWVYFWYYSVNEL